MTRLRLGSPAALRRKPPLDDDCDDDPTEKEEFADLLREGQDLRRAFEARTAGMRVLTAEDLARRSRG